MNLNEDNITFGIDGGKWIITNRQKTHNKVKISLLPIAEELIQKYEGHIKTKKTNEKTNEKKAKDIKGEYYKRFRRRDKEKEIRRKEKRN